MGTPGSGRYTTYVPVKSPRTQRLFKLFKFGAPDIYEGAETNALAANVTATNAKELFDGVVPGDPDMFGQGVSLKHANAPDTTEVAWSKAGDPANPYVPDLTSPGPGKTEGTEKDEDPKISSVDIKPNFDPSNPTVNTTSPSATSGRVGSLSLGENLTPGKSSAV
jgi:hypothetical protein